MNLILIFASYQCNILLDFVSCRWSNFGKNMFWLAIIGGGLINVHALLLLILKLKKKNFEKQRDYGVLTFPRFEMIIVNLALPSICQASAAIIRGNLTVCFFSPTNISISMHLSCKICFSKDNYAAFPFFSFLIATNFLILSLLFFFLFYKKDR